MYIPRNWEFGSGLVKLRNFPGWVEPPKHLLLYAIGSKDGKHVKTKCLPKSGSQYFTYTQYHSIALQAYVDENLNFMAVDVGTCGKQGGGGVFRYSALFQCLESRSLKLPGDTFVPKRLRWSLVPKNAGSNPAEAVGFFRLEKIHSSLPSEGK
jgi:hypothetical protein